MRDRRHWRGSCLSGSWLSPERIEQGDTQLRKIALRGLDGLLKARQITGIGGLPHGAGQRAERGEQTGGKFYIERPGKLRFNYDPPSNFKVTSDGTSLVLENTRLKTADIYPLSKTPLKLLLDDRIDLSGGRVRSVKEEPDLTTIQLADKSVFGDSTITMMFDPASYALRQWTITDAQGKDTTVMIFNVEEGVRFDPSVFAIDARRIQEMQSFQR